MDLVGKGGIGNILDSVGELTDFGEQLEKSAKGTLKERIQLDFVTKFSVKGSNEFKKAFDELQQKAKDTGKTFEDVSKEYEEFAQKIFNYNKHRNGADVKTKGYFGDIEDIKGSMIKQFEEIKAEGSKATDSMYRELYKYMNAFQAMTAVQNGWDLTSTDGFSNSLKALNDLTLGTQEATAELQKMFNTTRSKSNNWRGLPSLEQWQSSFKDFQAIRDKNLLGGITGIGKDLKSLSIDLSQMKMPDWMQMIPQVVGNGINSIEDLVARIKELQKYKIDDILDTDELEKESQKAKKILDELFNKYLNSTQDTPVKDLSKGDAESLLKSYFFLNKYNKEAANEYQKRFDVITQGGGSFKSQDFDKYYKKQKDGSWKILDSMQKDYLKKAQEEILKNRQRFDLSFMLFNTNQVPEQAKDYFDSILNYIASGKDQISGAIQDNVRKAWEDFQKMNNIFANGGTGGGSGSGGNGGGAVGGLTEAQIKAIDEAIDRLTQTFDGLVQKIEEFNKALDSDKLNDLISKLNESVQKMPEVISPETINSMKQAVEQLGLLHEKLKDGFVIPDGGDGGNGGGIIQFFKDLSDAVDICNRNIVGVQTNLIATSKLVGQGLFGDINTEHISALNSAFSTLSGTLSGLKALLSDVGMNSNEIKQVMKDMSQAAAAQSFGEANKKQESAEKVVVKSQTDTATGKKKTKTVSTPTTTTTTSTAPAAPRSVNPIIREATKMTVEAALNAEIATARAKGEGISQATIDGITNVIKDRFKDLENVGVNIGEILLGATQRVLGIHSPSTEYYDIGFNCIQGFINGIRASKPELLKEIQDLTDPKSIEEGLVRYFNNGGNISEITSEFGKYMSDFFPKGAKKAELKEGSKYFSRVMFNAREQNGIGGYQPLDEKAYEAVGKIPDGTKGLIDGVTKKIAVELGLTGSSLTKLREKINEMVTNVERGTEINFDSIKEILAKDANILKEAGLGDDANLPKMVKDALKGKRINIEDSFKAEFGDEWAERKKSLGRGVLTDKGGNMSVQEALQYINETVGHIFDLDQLSNNDDAIRALTDVAMGNVVQDASDYIDALIRDRVLDYDAVITDRVKKIITIALPDKKLTDSASSSDDVLPIDNGSPARQTNNGGGNSGASRTDKAKELREKLRGRFYGDTTSGVRTLYQDYLSEDFIEKYVDDLDESDQNEQEVLDKIYNDFITQQKERISKELDNISAAYKEIINFLKNIDFNSNDISYYENLRTQLEEAEQKELDLVRKINSQEVLGSGIDKDLSKRWETLYIAISKLDRTGLDDAFRNVHNKREQLREQQATSTVTTATTTSASAQIQQEAQETQQAMTEASMPSFEEYFKQVLEGWRKQREEIYAAGEEIDKIGDKYDNLLTNIRSLQEISEIFWDYDNLDSENWTLEEYYDRIKGFTGDEETVDKYIFNKDKQEYRPISEVVDLVLKSLPNSVKKIEENAQTGDLASLAPILYPYIHTGAISEGGDFSSEYIEHEATKPLTDKTKYSKLAKVLAGHLLSYKEVLDEFNKGTSELDEYINGILQKYEMNASTVINNSGSLDQRMLSVDNVIHSIPRWGEAEANTRPELVGLDKLEGAIIKSPQDLTNLMNTMYDVFEPTLVKYSDFKNLIDNLIAKYQEQREQLQASTQELQTATQSTSAPTQPSESASSQPSEPVTVPETPADTGEATPVEPITEDATELEAAKEKIEVALTEILGYYEQYIRKMMALYNDNKMLFNWGSTDKLASITASEVFGTEAPNPSMDNGKTPEISKFRSYVGMLLKVKQGETYTGQFGEGTYEDAQKELYSLFNDYTLDDIVADSVLKRIKALLKRMKKSLPAELVDTQIDAVPISDFADAIKLLFKSEDIYALFAEKLKGIIPQDAIEKIISATFNEIPGNVLSQDLDLLDLSQIVSGVSTKYVSGQIVASPSVTPASSTETEQQELEDKQQKIEESIQTFRKHVEKFTSARGFTVDETYLTPYINQLQEDYNKLQSVIEQFDENVIDERTFKADKQHSEMLNEFADIQKQFNDTEIPEDDMDSSYYENLTKVFNGLLEKTVLLKQRLGEIDLAGVSEGIADPIRQLTDRVSAFVGTIENEKKNIADTWAKSTQNPLNAPPEPPATTQATEQDTTTRQENAEAIDGQTTSQANLQAQTEQTTQAIANEEEKINALANQLSNLLALMKGSNFEIFALLGDDQVKGTTTSFIKNKVTTQDVKTSTVNELGGNVIGNIHNHPGGNKNFTPSADFANMQNNWDLGQRITALYAAGQVMFMDFSNATKEQVDEFVAEIQKRSSEIKKNYSTSKERIEKTAEAYEELINAMGFTDFLTTFDESDVIGMANYLHNAEQKLIRQQEANGNSPMSASEKLLASVNNLKVNKAPIARDNAKVDEILSLFEGGQLTSVQAYDKLSHERGVSNRLGSTKEFLEAKKALSEDFGIDLTVKELGELKALIQQEALTALEAVRSLKDQLNLNIPDDYVTSTVGERPFDESNALTTQLKSRITEELQATGYKGDSSFIDKYMDELKLSESNYEDVLNRFLVEFRQKASEKVGQEYQKLADERNAITQQINKFSMQPNGTKEYYEDVIKQIDEIMGKLEELQERAANLKIFEGMDKDLKSRLIWLQGSFDKNAADIHELAGKRNIATQKRDKTYSVEEQEAINSKRKELRKKLQKNEGFLMRYKTEDEQEKYLSQFMNDMKADTDVDVIYNQIIEQVQKWRDNRQKFGDTVRQIFNLADDGEVINNLLKILGEVYKEDGAKSKLLEIQGFMRTITEDDKSLQEAIDKLKIFKKKYDQMKEPEPEPKPEPESKPVNANVNEKQYTRGTATARYALERMAQRKDYDPDEGTYQRRLSDMNGQMPYSLRMLTNGVEDIISSNAINLQTKEDGVDHKKEYEQYIANVRAMNEHFDESVQQLINVAKLIISSDDEENIENTSTTQVNAFIEQVEATKNHLFVGILSWLNEEIDYAVDDILMGEKTSDQALTSYFSQQLPEMLDPTGITKNIFEALSAGLEAFRKQMKGKFNLTEGLNYLMENLEAMFNGQLADPNALIRKNAPVTVMLGELTGRSMHFAKNREQALAEFGARYQGVRDNPETEPEPEPQPDPQEEAKKREEAERKKKEEEERKKAEEAEKKRKEEQKKREEEQRKAEEQKRKEEEDRKKTAEEARREEEEAERKPEAKPTEPAGTTSGTVSAEVERERTTVNESVEGEIRKFGELKKFIQEELTPAIAEKTQAIINEKQAVDYAVDAEVKKFGELQGELDKITQSVNGASAAPKTDGDDDSDDNGGDKGATLFVTLVPQWNEEILNQVLDQVRNKPVEVNLTPVLDDKSGTFVSKITVQLQNQHALVNIQPVVQNVQDFVNMITTDVSGAKVGVNVEPITTVDNFKTGVQNLISSLNNEPTPVYVIPEATEGSITTLYKSINTYFKNNMIEVTSNISDKEVSDLKDKINSKDDPAKIMTTIEYDTDDLSTKKGNILDVISPLAIKLDLSEEEVTRIKNILNTDVPSEKKVIVSSIDENAEEHARQAELLNRGEEQYGQAEALLSMISKGKSSFTLEDNQAISITIDKMIESIEKYKQSVMSIPDAGEIIKRLNGQVTQLTNEKVDIETAIYRGTSSNFPLFTDLAKRIEEARKSVDDFKAYLSTITEVQLQTSGNDIFSQISSAFADPNNSINTLVSTVKSQITTLSDELNKIPSLFSGFTNNSGIVSFIDAESGALEKFKNTIDQDIPNAVEKKTDAFKKEKDEVEKFVRAEDESLKKLETRLANIADAAKGQLTRDVRKKFATEVHIFEKTGNIKEFTKALTEDRSFTIDRMRALITEGEFGLDAGAIDKFGSLRNRVKIITEISKQIQANRAPSKDIVTNIMNEYTKLADVFTSIYDHVKAINDMVKALDAQAVNDFSVAIGSIDQSWKDFINTDLGKNNILKVIDSILSKGDALKNFAKILQSSMEKIRNAAQQAGAPPTTGGGNGGNGGRNGGNGNIIRDQVAAQDDWEESLRRTNSNLEDYKQTLGDILKITQNIQRIYDDNGDVIEERVIGRTIVGRNATGFETITYDDDGKPTARMERKSDTPEDRWFEAERETKRANIRRMTSRLQREGIYDDFSARINDLSSELDNAVEHSALTMFNNNWNTLTVDIQTATANLQAFRQQNQRTFRDSLAALRREITVRSEYNRAQAQAAKKPHSLTQEQDTEYRQRVTTANAASNRAWRTIRRQYASNAITEEQYNEARLIYEGQDRQHGDLASRRALGTARGDTQIAEMKKQYQDALDIVKQLIDARTKLVELEAKAISKGDRNTVFIEQDATLQRVQELNARLPQATANVVNALNNGAITQQQHDDLEELLLSDDFRFGRPSDAINQAMITQYNKATTAVQNYQESVENVRKTQDRLANGENLTGTLNNQMQRMEKLRKEAQRLIGEFDRLNDMYALPGDGTQNSYRNRLHALDNSITDSYNLVKNVDRNKRNPNYGYETTGNAYDTLEKNSLRYYTIQAKKSQGQALTINEQQFMDTHGKHFQEYLDIAARAREAAQQAGQQLNESDQIAREFSQTLQNVNIDQENMQDLQTKNTQLAETNADSMRAVVGSYMDNIGATIDKLTSKPVQTEKFSNDVKQLKTEFLQFSDDIGKAMQNWDGQSKQDFENALQRLKTLSNQADKLTGPNANYNVVNQVAKAALGRKMSEWKNTNSAGYDYFPEIDELQQKLRGVKDQGELNNIAMGFEHIKRKAAEAGKTGKSFADQLKGSMGNLGRYLLSFNSFYRITGTLRQGINIVKELDTALVEMSKTSDETRRALKNYQLQTFAMADALGTTSVKIQQSTADWTRLGFTLKQASEMAQLSIKLLNVSEFTDINQATEALVSAAQAYKDVNPDDLVDKLNLIGNRFSISTSDLAQGLQNAAAVLVTQNNSFDEALALITSGNSITQDVSKVSAGIRTISLRIAGTEEAKGELQEIGEAVDDFTVKTRSKTDKIIRDYTAVASNAYKGVSVLDANGNLRSTYDIKIMCPHTRNLCA